MSKKLIIFGIGQIAEVIYTYFTHDSEYEVVAFTVDKDFQQGLTNKFNLPVIPFEEIENHFLPKEFEIFVAMGFNNINKNREQKCIESKEKGYKLASYLSTKAMVWPDFELKENTFIFENNVIQPFVKVGSNVTLWSGNHVGHHSSIGDNVFVTSHAVISGAVNIGKNSFVGVNATIRDNVNIGDYCIIGAGTLVLKNIPDKVVLAEKTTKRFPMNSDSLSKL